MSLSTCSACAVRCVPWVVSYRVCVKSKKSSSEKLEREDNRRCCPNKGAERSAMPLLPRFFCFHYNRIGGLRTDAFVCRLWCFCFMVLAVVVARYIDKEELRDWTTSQLHF